MHIDVSKGGPTSADSTSRRLFHRAAVPASSAVATLALLLAAPQPLLAQQGAATQQGATAQHLRKSVTLITGDRVVVSGQDFESVSIQPAAGREKVRFSIDRFTVGRGKTPHLFVVPNDAARLIAAGKVDRQLFDVSLLIENRYDDANRSSLPFIVTYPKNAGPLAAARPRAVAGAVVDRNLASVNGMAISSPKARVHDVWSTVVSSAAPATARALASEPIEKIWLDGLLQPVLDRSVAQIGAPHAWDLGYEGNGITVAVLDTGVDHTHPDFADQAIISENFTESPDGDDVGHGTHVASIIAGTGAAADGLYRGVAPGVQLVSGKVCEEFGCPESSIIAGMQWAVIDQGADVINMSLGGPDTPDFDPVEEALSTLTAQYGALFVVAAGNAGPLLGSTESPGGHAAALTVGAVDHDDVLADFSSRGMTVDMRLKPDLTAPGVDIVAARAAGTEIGPVVGDDYVALSGTSMATPHVAGAVALLLEAHPEWTPADAKAALTGTAAFNPAYGALEQGGGRADIVAALDASFFANATNLSFGIAEWPHDDDVALTRTVTYRNRGPATELAIEVDIHGPDGAPAPDGMFSVTPSIASLPEDGNVSVSITANTSVSGADGIYSGRIIASDGAGRSLAIPVAVHREVESYTLTLRHLDRQGARTANWAGFVVPYERPLGNPYVDPPGALATDVPLRLPKGRYAIYSYIQPLDFSDVAWIIAPNQLLDRDRLLVMDASAAAPVTVLPPREGLELVSSRATWGIPTDIGSFASTLFTDTLFGNRLFYLAEVEPRNPGLESLLEASWADPVATPREYHAAAWTERGRLVPAGTHSLADLNPAIVNATYQASLSKSQLSNFLFIGAATGSDLYPGLATQLSIEPPLQLTQYFYTPADSASWYIDLETFNEDFSESMLLGLAPQTYESGQTYSTVWNEPVFSTVLVGIEDEFWAAGVRDGDLLTVQPPLYGDSQGHPGIVNSNGTTRLYRNGELIADARFVQGNQFEVPPERATYRIELEQSQSLFELTTRQSIAWTFESEHVEAGQLQRVPLLAVRFAPELDERGRAPSGTPFELPLSIDQYGQVSSTLESAPSVEVSYDDGASWSTSSLEPSGARWVAHLQHPTGAEYVSLRTSARDLNGNAVEQTLIRAYALAQ